MTPIQLIFGGKPSAQLGALGMPRMIFEALSMQRPSGYVPALAASCDEARHAKPKRPPGPEGGAQECVDSAQLAVKRARLEPRCVLTFEGYVAG